MFPLIIAFLLIVLIAAVMLGVLEIQKKQKNAKRHNNQETNQFPYVRKQFFSNNEKKFFEALKYAVNVKYLIMAQVKLSDIIEITQELTGNEKTTYRNKIQQKHIDFILLNPHDYSVVLAIELDDTTHNRQKVMQSDEFKNNALAAAQIPLLRIKTAREYPIRDISYAILNAIKQPQKTTM